MPVTSFPGSGHRASCLTCLLLIISISCGSGTEGKRVRLQTRVVTAAEDRAAVVTATGWTVTLRQAALATGPFYYFAGAPGLVAHPWGKWWRWLQPRPAWAHPGHYRPGQALGQMLSPHSVNLMEPETRLPDGEGVTGLIRSASFSFSQPVAGPVLAQLGPHVVVVIGVARKLEREVHFRAQTSWSELSTRIIEGVVDGCAFADTQVHGPGLVTVTVRPSQWFQLVDFRELPDGSAAVPTPLETSATAQTGFLVGLAQRSAYAFAFQHVDEPDAATPAP